MSEEFQLQHQKHSIGITKETMSVTFTVRDFSFIFATHSRELAASVDPRSVEELTVNAVSSSDVLRAGQYSFRISIGWSLGRDMSTQAHSMLGVAVERVDRGVDIVAVSFELKLVNQKFPEKSVVMSTEAPLGITERGLKGWFPAPYADRRESADGFVLLKEVLDPAKGWLENDSLVVECTMTVGVSQPHSLDRKGPPPTTALEDLSSDMAQLLESEGDVCLQVGQEVITAHSIILSTRSPVFKAMLSHSMKEQSSRQVEICDLEASAVRRMVEYMYTGKVAAVLGDNEPTVALLQAAHRYQVKGLVDLCVAAVASNLKLETSADRLMLAEHIGIDSLKRDCLSMMVTSTAHVREVQHSEAYRHLRSKRPALAADLLAAAFPSKTSRCTVSR